MLKLQDKIPKPLGVVVITLIGLGAPLYGLRNLDWSSVEATPFSIGMAILYLGLVSMFALAALGVTGKQFTSPEKDLEIKRKFDAGYRKLLPYLAAIWLSWVLYLVWRLYSQT